MAESRRKPEKAGFIDVTPGVCDTSDWDAILIWVEELAARWDTRDRRCTDELAAVQQAVALCADLGSRSSRNSGDC